MKPKPSKKQTTTTTHEHIATTSEEITTTQGEIATTPIQMDLDGQIKFQLNQVYKLSENQKKLMETFYLNTDSEISPKVLFESWGTIMHENAIHRFIKRAKVNRWIRELEKIKGTVVNNLFGYYASPDTLETGKIIKDGRCKYYKITNLGKKIFEINDKLT